MSDHIFDTLVGFLGQLDRAHIHYTLANHREDAVMVSLSVPGERVEVEFLADGSVEVERFISDGEICGQDALQDILNRFGEPVS
jgi:hypothetical protein